MLEYIASRDRNNAKKLAAILRGPEAGEIVAKAQEFTGIGHKTVYTVFCAPEKITAKWCAEFAEQAADKSGLEVARVEIKKENGDAVIYWTKQNCLRVYRKSGSGVDCIYENNNGLICNDVVALMCSGAGNPYKY